jgi:hypothetical protein
MRTPLSSDSYIEIIFAAGTIRVRGVVLIILGPLIIVFGDRNVGKDGGDINRTFSIPTLNAKLLKWGVGILCIWFGMALLFGRGHL